VDGRADSAPSCQMNLDRSKCVPSCSRELYCLLRQARVGEAMTEARFPTVEELQQGLATIRLAPREQGALSLIVRRPSDGRREVVETAELDPVEGLLGDNWRARGSRHMADGSAHPGMQLTLMNARAIALVARQPDRWPLAGDQLYVDLDLSFDNLPVGARLAIGSATIEVTAVPHTGCKLFAERFGKDAVKFVNSPNGKQLRLRGLNAKVVRGGTIRVGDLATRL